MKREKAEREE